MASSSRGFKTRKHRRRRRYHQTTTQLIIAAAAAVLSDASSTTSSAFESSTETSSIASTPSYHQRSPSPPSSVDTNHTQLMRYHHQQQQQEQQQYPNTNPFLPLPTVSLVNTNPFRTTAIIASSTTTTSSKFMIIQPAVSIDRNFDSDTGAPADETDDFTEFWRWPHQRNFQYYSLENSLNNNTNNGNSNSDCNYYANCHSNRNHLLSKAPVYQSSWRWCTLICAAMRCFGGSRTSSSPASSNKNATNSASFSHQRYGFTRIQQTTTTTTTTTTMKKSVKQPQQLYSTPRKTRDHLNNICYEL